MYSLGGQDGTGEATGQLQQVSALDPEIRATAHGLSDVSWP